LQREHWLSPFLLTALVLWRLVRERRKAARAHFVALANSICREAKPSKASNAIPASSIIHSKTKLTEA
jgi:hypothetical protein